MNDVFLNVFLIMISLMLVGGGTVMIWCAVMSQRQLHRIKMRLVEDMKPFSVDEINDIYHTIRDGAPYMVDPEHYPIWLKFNELVGSQPKDDAIVARGILFSSSFVRRVGFFRSLMVELIKWRRSTSK